MIGYTLLEIKLQIQFVIYRFLFNLRYSHMKKDSLKSCMKMMHWYMRYRYVLNMIGWMCEDYLLNLPPEGYCDNLLELIESLNSRLSTDDATELFCKNPGKYFTSK